MKIDSIKSPNYNHFNFQGIKLNKVVEKLSTRDFYAKIDTSEFVEMSDLYNNLYKKMALPENLKPPLRYKAMSASMSFSIGNYTINAEKRLSPFKMEVRNKNGIHEALLRHEIEHVKQFWDIVRLLGVKKAVKMLKANRVCKVNPNLYKKMKEIEQTLGRISSNSKEGKNAQLYVDALINYPELDRYYGQFSLKEVVTMWRYKTNLLEKRANLAAKEYKPSLLKRIKIAFQEYVKLLSYSTKSQ